MFGAGRGAEREKPAEIDEHLGRIILRRFRNRWLDETQGHVRHIGRMALRQAIISPCCGGGDEHHGRQGRRPPVAGEIAEPGRQGCGQAGDEAQPVNADERSELQHGEAVRKRARPRIADEVPWKSGEHMTAKPLGHHPAQNERANASGAAEAQHAAQQVADAKRGAGEDRETRRHAHDRKRHEPPEMRDIDEQGRGDPIEPGDKEAEAEAPSQRKGGERAAAAIGEPDQAGKGNRAAPA